MRAAALASFGPPGALRVTEVEQPKPGPGEVRVRVRAAGVLPFDCLVREGWTPPGRSVTFPLVVGNEFAGAVDAVGADVTGFTTGDEVLGFCLLRGYAEYVVVPADQVVHKPSAMPWQVAGGFSGNGQGAHMPA